MSQKDPKGFSPLPCQEYIQQIDYDSTYQGVPFQEKPGTDLGKRQQIWLILADLD